MSKPPPGDDVLALALRDAPFVGAIALRKVLEGGDDALQLDQVRIVRIETFSQAGEHGAQDEGRRPG